MKSKARPANKAEKARIDCMMQMSCILCALAGDFRLRKIECHHIVRDNKRLGHWFTLPLCVGHHRGVWTDQAVQVGIASGRHRFEEVFGYTELDLWQRLQVAMGLDALLPVSKIVPRRELLTEALVSMENK